MKISLTVLLLAVCGALAVAQTPAQKKAAAAKTAAVETAAAPKAVKPAPAKPAPARPAEEAEESVVMIDSKADAEPEAGGRYSAGAFGGEQEEPVVPGGLPSSYGQCKGVITEAGRSVLVFENSDDGAISLVQLVLGKGKASWKLLDRIPRSAD
ncbi:MAG: hypothetical protein A2X31_10480 [Elusimicrobia bacterium GWB2_63_22]|nr:MAG: hypothetical protein A2X31_10480 [Elusimicrobia bacterium GWB2_63_22]